jgi:hypothetical protein
MATTRLLTKVLKDGRTLTFDLIEEERVRLRAEIDGEEYAASTELYEIEPGVGRYRHAPAGMVYAFATGGRGIGLLSREDGAMIKAAYEAALARATARHLATLDPELADAIRRYRNAERAREAEDVRAYDLMVRAGL